MPSTPATSSTSQVSTSPSPSSRRPALVAATAAPASALAFSESVRQLVAVANRSGLKPPVFRSPPGIDGVDRTIRRTRRGAVVVAVRRGDRPLAAVQSDIIDGLVAANGLTGADADRVRRAAWGALQGDGDTQQHPRDLRAVGSRTPPGGVDDRHAPPETQAA